MTQQEPELEAETGKEDIETLKQALTDEKTKAETNLSGWQRAQADFENYKRRSQQEKAEVTQFANASLFLNLLPIIDDFELAFNSVPPELAGNSWIDGVKLIERKMKASLEAQGLSTIQTVGEPFDPRLHEAVRQVKGKEGIVIEEVQKGYKFRDRVIRPSKVVVGNGE